MSSAPERMAPSGLTPEQFRTIRRRVSNRARKELVLLQDALRVLGHWRPPDTRFFIFAQGRSGSTLLVSLLNCHPDILCDDEILNVRQFRRFRSPYFRVICRSRAAVAANKRAYGFHVKIYQLTKDHGMVDPGGFVRRLHRQGWRVIYLRRSNVMRQALSNQIANRRGYSSVGPDKAHRLVRAEPIVVDVEAVLRGVAGREAYQREEAQALEGIDHLALEYERDLLHATNQQAAANRVFEFLGLDPAPVQAGLNRIGKDRLSDYIENYDELFAALQRHGYEHYLDHVDN